MFIPAIVFCQDPSATDSLEDNFNGLQYLNLMTDELDEIINYCRLGTAF